MASVNLPLPFEAYTGTEPYIFVSYAHRDGAIVYPLLKALHDEGYRLWYDEGIDPGNEWPEEIARALTNAAWFLVFITRNAVDSRNVRNEINFALNRSKPFLAIHLDEMELPPGLALRMGDIQAILKWRMTDDHYRRKLLKTLPESLRETSNASRPPVNVAAKQALSDTLSLDLGGGVALECVLIRPGVFMMGNDKSDQSDERPAHKVRITKPFYMGKFEVTQEQWEKVTGANPSYFKGAKNPVERVSWDDCQGFLAKLKEKSPGPDFRLPTEAQWEYACRAGTTTAFSFGDAETALGDYAWFGSNSGSTTHEVGKKRPNVWGLYDMHGNVWEWCADWKAPYSDGEAVDPIGPTSGSSRVLRGGSWYRYATNCRSACRDSVGPADRLNNCGMRLVVVPR